IVTQRRNLAEQFLKARPGLDRKLDKDTAQELLDADLSVYVDPAAVGKQYGEALAKFRETMEEKLKEEDSPFANSPEMLAVFKEPVKGVVQFLSDSEAVLISARAEPEGLKLHARVRLGADTKTGKLLASEKPETLDEIGDLPLTQSSFLASKPAKGKEWRAL